MDLDLMNARSAAPAAQRGRRASFVERRFAILMSLPAFGLVAAVTVLPIFVGLGYSLTNFDINHPNLVRFIGLDNYAALLHDQYLPQVLVTPYLFVVGGV